MFRLYHVLLFLESYALGSVIVFQSSPATTIQGLTQYVRLRCTLNDTAASSTIVGRRDTTSTPDNVEQVSSIIIMHNNVDIASVTQSHPAKSMVAASNMEVSGDVSSKTGERGFLELKLHYPAEMQLGEFECEIVATKPNGHGAIFNVHTETNVTQPTIMDLVNEIKVGRTTDQQLTSMVQSQQSYITSLQNENTAQQSHISTLESTVSSLQNENTAQQSHISTLESTVSSLQHSLSSLQTQVNSLQGSVGFITNTGLQVRLLGGNGRTTGAVELMYNGATGMLCDDQFEGNNNGAKVVCKMLGFSHGEYHDGDDYASVYTSGSHDFLLDSVVCTGSESSLAYCSHDAWGSNDCSLVGDIAGVHCSSS